MIAETACPWTFAGNDNFSNIQYKENLLKCYGPIPSPSKQQQFLTNLSWVVKEAGGMAVIYWEPGWVSSTCQTPWGIGSSWENSTFFDFNNNLHSGINFMTYDYTTQPPELEPVNLTLKVAMGTTDTTNGVYATGDFTGANWSFKRMKHIGNKIFELNAELPGMSTGAFIFQNKADWNSSSRETVPASCALFWDTHREYIITHSDTTIGCAWSSCSSLAITELQPNPSFNVRWMAKDAFIDISTDEPIQQAHLYTINGKTLICQTNLNSRQLHWPIAGLAKGMYFLQLVTKHQQTKTIKLIF
jgi:arabinogalactan endo-1,4-beta-galactosidase